MNSAALQTFVSQLLSNPLVFLVPFFVFSWFLMLVLGNPMIAWIKRFKGMKWSPREDTPDSHLQKAGTPSMGGLGILGAATLSWVGALTLLFGLSSLTRGRIGLKGWDWLALNLFLICVLAHCALGFADDWSKAKRRGGLSSKAKLLGQFVLGASFLLFVRVLLSTNAIISAKMDAHLLMGWVVSVVCLLIIIGTSNAVNLTDGIDGLAAGLSVQVSLVFGVLALETWQKPTGLFGASAPFVWLALGGACLGFLAFNKYPAKVFMGDTGSLALGAALGAGAILTRSVFLLPFIGFIFYIEMFSVIAQVLYFKYTKKKFGEGRRIFRRAPLHHHFELGGWSEWRVVGTFWAINAATTILGLILWKMGVLRPFP